MDLSRGLGDVYKRQWLIKVLASGMRKLVMDS
jgi:hypothetical protein